MLNSFQFAQTRSSLITVYHTGVSLQSALSQWGLLILSLYEYLLFLF